MCTVMSYALYLKAGITCTRIEVDRAGGGCAGCGGSGSGDLRWDRSRNVFSDSVVFIRPHCKQKPNNTDHDGHISFESYN